MKIGYARVSTLTQNMELQIDALKKAGCEKIITEQASCSVANRAELLQVKECTLRSGDIFVVRAWGAMEQPTDLRSFCCS